MSEPRTIKQLLELGERVLEDSTHLDADHDLADNARELLAAAMGTTELDLEPNLEPPLRTRERFLAFIARRAAGEPLPFLTGHTEFYGLRLRVRPGAFVPRSSSELLVDWAVDRLRDVAEPVIVDVATGSGPIALALASSFPDGQVWGTDISEEAIRQGRGNAKELGLNNVRLVTGDMYGALPAELKGQVDLVSGNVPYVPPDEVEDLPSEIRDYEPIHTLTDASGDGLGLVRIAIEGAAEWLKPGGWLELETSEDLGPIFEELCFDNGFVEVGTVEDDDRLSIVVEARRPGAARINRGRRGPAR